MPKIHAASCTLEKNIALEELSIFIEENHRQGMPSSAKGLQTVGLRYKGLLVGCVAFCTPRTKLKLQEYHKELLRMCFRKDYIVLEGASRMIEFYRQNFSVSDFFTYQDMTGQASQVYEHCGMTLVSQAKKKEYLVAPGKTLATASRKEALGMAYATRYGPDRILGTKVGEVFHPSGKRKSNKEIFLEDLGWHVEVTPGDRIYEWVNPHYTFYTYRITATASDKYYLGVRSLRKPSASVDDCLEDFYFGSGGPRFKHWYAKHKLFVEKEILGVYLRRRDAFAAEKALVGNLYRSDPLCLNEQAGGIASGGSWGSHQQELKVCDVHGESIHKNNKCLNCVFSASIHVEECSTHGRVKHQGETCLSCKSEKSFSVKNCTKHGDVTFRGKTCLSCKGEASYVAKTCGQHGLTTFRGERCLECLREKTIREKECSLHGVTKHFGDTCAKCSRQGVFTEGVCAVHGGVTLEAGKCVLCKAERLQAKEECPVHGVTWHVAGKCRKCFSEEAWSRGDCVIHGGVAFYGGTCWRCKNEKQVKEKTCPLHGETKFIGDSCYRCANQKTVTVKICSVHGESKHQGESCCKCAQAKRFAIKECPTHGMVKHNGNSCFTCSNQRARTKRS